MLIEMNTIITKNYYVGSSFYIEIVKDIMENYYEAWIWNENYGIKEHMFSVPMEQQTYIQFLKIIENNLNEYIDDYKQNYIEREIII